MEELPPRHFSIFSHMMGAYFPCAVAIISLSPIPSRTFSLPLSNVSSSSFLHFCYIFLLSHPSLLLKGISSYIQLSATITNTYFYFQSVRVSAQAS